MISTDLDKLFYQELRGKTVSLEQSSILGWAEKRLKPAISRYVEQRILAELESLDLPDRDTDCAEFYVDGNNPPIERDIWLQKIGYNQAIDEMTTKLKEGLKG